MNPTIKQAKTYVFQVNTLFGTLSKETVNTLFQDGRVSSQFLTAQLPHWFPSLKYIDDHCYEDNNGVTYCCKCFTKTGASFTPNDDVVYIFCDITKFPEVRVVFRSTNTLLKYSKGKVPHKDRYKLFT